MLRLHANLLLFVLPCWSLGACSTAEGFDVAAVSSAAALSGADTAAGEALFFKPFPDVPSNGRACGTCHVAEDALQLTPSHVEARWQDLQMRRQHDPDADDPLFRSIDADDHQQDFSLLRRHALVRVVIDLPRDADGNKLVWPVDDPDATRVELFRATPSVANVALTAPYQSDGRFSNLLDQASGALHGHAEIECEPAAESLEDLAAFERTQFSSPQVAAVAAALERGEDPVDRSACLRPLEQQGKALFEKHCAVCHGGPTMNVQAPIVQGPGTRDILLSKPLPAFAEDLPFAESPVRARARVWAVKVPGQAEPVLRESTDPGIILQTGKLDNFNEFDVPTVLGIAGTAPYFRDNSAATLHDVVHHYQQLAEALRRVIPADSPARPPRIEDEDFAPLIAYLETL